MNLEVFEVSQPGPTEAAAVQAQTDGGELTERTKLIDPMTMEESSVPFLSGAEAAVESAARKTKIKPLSLLPLIALIFYDVSGGPFGTEDAVSAGGPLLAILGFLLLPLIWSVPEALITAELATTFPENSGYVAWVTAAFGPFWGFQEGFWSWVSGVTDNSLYPVMFLSYLDALVPGLKTGWQRTILLVVVSLALSYLNYRGLHIVGHTAVFMTGFIILPFLVLMCLALPHIKPGNWGVVDWKAVQWGDFLNVMFWNLNYWDSVSTLAGEVPNPAKTFPKALFGAVVLVTTTYALPLIVGLGVTTDIADWKLGYFASLAKQVGGHWLSWWMVAAAAVSQIGQFEAEMSSDSFQLLGMAERGFLPKALGRRSKHDTPTIGIILSSLGVLSLSTFNFLQIVELLNIVYCLAELMEFAAFIYLRYKVPGLYRPYRVPLPNWAVTLMLLPAGALLCVILALPIARGDWQMMAWTGGTIVIGLLLYPFLQMAREREWFEFVGETPHDFQTNLYASLPVVSGSDLNTRPVINGAPVMTADELHVGQAQEPLVAAPPAAPADPDQADEL